MISSSSSSDFWLTCRYRGYIHNSGPPSRQLACCTHGRSHTRSPGISIMRVDSWELPLSAIPLCQLLPSHLGPPRPTLSINLYVKGCLDCTVGAFHMSIPVEPSLFQYEVQIFNSEPCKELNGPDGGRSTDVNPNKFWIVTVRSFGNKEYTREMKIDKSFLQFFGKIKYCNWFFEYCND